MSGCVHHVLIDHENVQPENLELLHLGPFRVKLFLGPGQHKLATSLAIGMQQLGEHAEYIQLESAGKNALDFHITYYLGQLTAREPAAHFHIISRDSGFDPLIKHLRARKIAASRHPAIADIPLLKALSTRQPAELATPARPPLTAVTPATSSPTTSSPATSSLESQIERVITNLKARPSGKPASEKALLNTVHALFGKQLASARLHAIHAELIRRGVIRVNAGKLSYQL